ncbi:MAG: phosphatase PAP2 family protein, partial [Acidothermaceae bacterium]
MLDSSPARSGVLRLPAAALSRWRWRVLAVLAGAYVGLTIAVVVGSALDGLDRRAAAMDLARHWPDLEPWVLRYEVTAQRGPSAAVAAAYLLWRAWRARSSRPIVMLGTALLLLNVSVGAVKLAIGRLGPLLTTHPRAVFDGGDIFPSGHTSNAVVVFGVLAVLACEHRRLAITLAGSGATTIGLGTVFLDTHWVTDVFGGWLAGGIVLLVLPEATTCAQRLISSVARWYRGCRPITA